METKEAQIEDCKKGNHKFVDCDEHERTCLYCGVFEKKN